MIYQRDMMVTKATDDPEVMKMVLKMVRVYYLSAQCDWCGEESLQTFDNTLESPLPLGELESYLDALNWVAFVLVKNDAACAFSLSRRFHFCSRRCRADFCDHSEQVTTAEMHLDPVRNDYSAAAVAKTR